MKSVFIGIDIQTRRDCSYAVIDDDGILIDSGWFSDSCKQAVTLIEKFHGADKIQVGIDAPRMPLTNKREWFWDRKNRGWKRRVNQNGYGRHCEIVLSVHRIANPQWTPIIEYAPEWMQLGFQLFSVLSDKLGASKIHEIFPSASYTILQNNHDIRINMDFSACKPGPKDLLDAVVAAVTVREFSEKQGCEIGGGDGLGTILLPRPLPEPIIAEVLDWPTK